MHLLNNDVKIYPMEGVSRMIIFSNRQKMITYCLKLIVIVSSFVGVLLSALASMDTFMGGSTVFMYFTIQSNIAIGLICLCGCILLLLNKKIPYAWGVIKFVGTVSITLTGFVFTFVLAPTLGSNAWTLANVLTHLTFD